MILRKLATIAAFIGLSSSAFAQSPYPQESYIRFNSETAGQVRDYGLNAGSPSLVGNAQIQQAGVARGSALSLDGNNGHLISNRQLALVGDWSLEMMFMDKRPSSDGSLSYLVGSHLASGFRIFRGGVAGTGNLRIIGPGFDLTINNALTPNAWQHIQVIHDQGSSSTIDVVLDGVHRGVTNVTGSTVLQTGSQGLTVGSRGGSGVFKGLIDELRLWNGVRLSESEYETKQLPLADSFPFVEGFEEETGLTAAPAFWVNEEENGSPNGPDWSFRSNSTPSLGTGPSTDRLSGGRYAYLEDSNSDASQVVFTMPLVDLAETSGIPRLRFWVHSKNASANPNDANSLHIVVKPRNAPPVILSPIGHLGSDWQRVQYNLQAFDGQLIKISFIGNNNNGTFTHDIAIDDIAIVETQGSGVVADLDKAALDINNALGVDGLPVNYGLSGPHASTIQISGGEALELSVLGRPNQPIVLIHGALNTGFLPFGGLSVGSGFGGDGVSIFANGLDATVPNVFYRTNGSGEFAITIPTFGLAQATGGIFNEAFQAVVLTGDANVIAFSNAVNVTFF